MVSTQRAEQFMREKSINFFFETSAKSGENVEDVFITASKILFFKFKDKFDQMVSLFPNPLTEGKNASIERRRKRQKT